MINIYIKKYKEIFANPTIGIYGKWNVSVMHQNGEEEFVFGKEMKPNMILNQGLDILASAKHYTSYNNLNWNTIPAFLFGGAKCGLGNTISVNDTDLSIPFQYTNNVNDFSCRILDDIPNGRRGYRKVYDFPILNETQRNIGINEMGITTPWNKNQDGTEKIFSKFILPNTIRLMPEQWLRLYYDFYISPANIINSTSIEIQPTPSYPNFNPNGNIRLAGRFHDIFGSFDENGFMRIEYGDSPRGSFLPYWDEFCLRPNDQECFLKCFGTAYLIEDTYAAINVNQEIICQWIGERLEHSKFTIEATDYINNNFYRDITYIFDKNNPFENKLIDGFLFTVVRSDRQNTIDGWFWQINQKQNKFIDKKLVIMMRQSVSRN
jgi:hypothetical protein